MIIYIVRENGELFFSDRESSNVSGDILQVGFPDFVFKLEGNTKDFNKRFDNIKDGESKKFILLEYSSIFK